MTLLYFLAGDGVLIDNLVKEMSKVKKDEIPMVHFGVERLSESYNSLLNYLKIGGVALIYLILLLNLPKILMFGSKKQKDENS